MKYRLLSSTIILPWLEYGWYHKCNAPFLQILLPRFLPVLYISYHLLLFGTAVAAVGHSFLFHGRSVASEQVAGCDGRRIDESMSRQASPADPNLVDQAIYPPGNENSPSFQGKPWQIRYFFGGFNLNLVGEAPSKYATVNQPTINHPKVIEKITGCVSNQQPLFFYETLKVHCWL